MQKQILLFNEDSATKFDSFKDLFQNLSEKGVVVTELTDGKIESSEGTWEFTFIENKNSKAEFINSVEDYRTTLRESVMLLKKQGIEVNPEELSKLAKQFEFLTGETAEDTEEDTEEDKPEEE